MNTNRNKRILALLLACCMTLSFAGCLVPENKTPDASDAPEETAASAAPVDTSNYDPAAAAVELGSIVITAGEIEDSFSYYKSMLESYYGVSLSDEQSIQEYRDMAINDLIHYYMPQWKAEQMGISLTDEEEADIEKNVGEEVDEMRTGLICEYAYYYGGAAEIYDDVAKLTGDELTAAMAQIDSELTEYYYAGYTLEQYLEEQYKNRIVDGRINALVEKLRDATQEDFTVTDGQADEWYETTLADQQESFTQDPENYREAEELYRAGSASEPVLYVPEGVLRVQLIAIAPDAERDLKIETNRAEMAQLEAEYGKLALNGENAARQEEILARYAALKAESDELEEAFIGDARTKINRAYEALEEETPFEDVMKQYNREGDTSETLLFADGDARYGELSDYAGELLIGTYSEPILIDDVYYIVKLLEKPAAGAIDRASIEEAIRAAAVEAAKDAAWDQLYAEWQTEAETAAVRHEDAYAAIGWLN